MSSFADLPFVRTLAASDKPTDRALFIRLAIDLACMGPDRVDPEQQADCRTALRLCLANAVPPERRVFIEEILRMGAGPFFGLTRREAVPEAPRKPEVLASALRAADSGMLLELVRNPAFRPDPERLARLVKRARGLLEAGDNRLAQALLARRPLPLEMAPLFLEADGDQRAALMLAAQRAELGRPRAQPQAKLGRAALAQLDYTAIAGAPAEFANQLARAIGAAPELAARIAADPSGEPLVVALIATGAPNDLCVRVLTARDIPEGATYPRLHALSRLSGRLSLPAARRLVTAIVGAQTFASPRATKVSAARRAPSRETREAAPAIPETRARSAQNSRNP